MRPFRVSKTTLFVSLLVAATLVVASKSTTDSIGSSKSQQKQPISRRNVKQTETQQKVADKKQGDIADSSAAESASIAQQLASEEFVHIKPEELSAAISNDRDLEAAIGLRLGNEQTSGSLASSASSPITSQQNERHSSGATGAQPDSMVAEHKSAVDEELNAHLAQDSLNPMESSYAPQASAPRSYGQVKMSPPVGRPYMPGGSGQVPRAPRPYGSHGSRHYGARAPAPYGQPMVRAPQPYRGPRGMHPPAHRPPAYMMPPVYINGLRGKLGSLGGSGGSHGAQAPATGYGGSPAVNHPPAGGHSGIGGTRYLPRGAAAGYAAFREFVRAQANKYKQGGALVEQLAYGPTLPPMMPPAPQHLASPPSPYAPAEPATGSYKQAAPSYSAPKGVPASSSYSPASEAAAPASSGYAESSGPSKTRVAVTQAYIPHPITPAAPAAADYSTGSAAPQQYAPAPAAAPAPTTQYGSSPAAPTPINPVLAKLYHEHGSYPPQGKQEYSKDFGMVIHYPQATVYAEPMTMEQLHKLTGNGISQILERLQYQLATGGNRDESNTLRPNNKHHIGHGFTIQAKEFYAPGKAGHYVPTTAAVISSPGQNGYGAPQQQSYGQSAPEPAHVAPSPEPAPAPVADEHAAAGESSYQQGAGKPDQLGSGYERVKNAVAASQASGRYNDKTSGNKYQQSGPSKGYETEPLSAITSMLGSELESLFKGNGALFNKHMEPEIHSQIQAYAKGGKAHQPIRYTEHNHKAPLVLQHPQQYGSNRRPPMMQYGRGGPRRPHMAQGYGPKHPSMMRGPRAHPPQHPMRPHPANYGRPQQQQQYPQSHPPMRGPAAQNYQQQQYGPNAVEQAVQQQVMQILQDFKSGDEQYYGKQNQPMQIVNQGYPHKIMQQKQYQQQQPAAGKQYPQQQYAQQQSGAQYQAAQGQRYESGALEIPQSPNDQIGELADLVESLKGALEGHKPEGPAEIAYTSAVAPASAAAPTDYQQAPKYASASPAKQADDLRYVSTALGQVPSYAMQVPVTNGDATSNASSGAYDSHSSAGSYQASPAQQAAGPVAHYEAPAQAEPAPIAHQAAAEQAPASAYGSSQVSGAYGSSQAASGQAYGLQQQQSYSQAAPQQQSYGAAEASSGQQLHQSNDYQQQVEYQSSGSVSAAPGYSQQLQQHPLSSSEFASAVQQVASSSGAASDNGYGSQSAGAAQLAQQPIEASAYLAEPAQQQQQQSPQQTYSQAYSTSEHTQVINHLVPTVAQAAAPAQSGGSASYESTQSAAAAPSAVYGSDHSQSQQQQHPINQISIAAPTESQYQSAQPLSSLVDSFPSEYQELLRHPSAMDSIGSHALESQTAPASYALYPSNATSSSATQTSGSASASQSASSQAQQTAADSPSKSYLKSSSASSSHPSSSSSSSSPSQSTSASSSAATASGTKSASSSSSLSDKSASSASASSQIKK